MGEKERACPCLMLLKKGFEVDGDQGRKGEKDQGQSAWGCISYSCSIINMCLLKAVNVPWRLYLKNIDKDFNLISQIIIISQTRTEVIARVRLTRPQPVETSDIWEKHQCEWKTVGVFPWALNMKDVRGCNCSERGKSHYLLSEVICIKSSLHLSIWACQCN